MIYSLDSVMGSFPFAATVTIIDKTLFKYRRKVIKQKVVNNPVAKIGREDLSFYGFINNKANTGSRFISSFNNLTPQFNQLMFEIDLELYRAAGIPLIFPRGKIGPEKIGQERIRVFHNDAAIR